MKTIDDLQEFFTQDLGGALYELESDRRDILKKTKSLVITTGMTLIISVAVILLIKSAAVFCVGVAIISVVIAIAWYFIGIAPRIKTFTDRFKQSVIGSLVQFIDPGLDFYPDRFIHQGNFMQSTIFKQAPDRYKGEDYVCGSIDGTNLEFSEIHAEYKTETRNSKGHRSTQWHTIFKGVFFIAEFNKNFKGATIILPDLAEKMFGFLGTTLQKWNLSREDLVKLEDPEFEKQFVVYGDDQIESRYILTTSMMERIMNFYKSISKISGKELYLAFIDGKIFIAISSNKDLFEPKLLSPNDNLELIKEYFLNLQLLTGIVEELKLNRKINKR